MTILSAPATARPTTHTPDTDTPDTHTPDTTTAAPRGATAGAALELVERARADLLEACHSRGVAERYHQSQLAALRAAAALVSARVRGGWQPGPQSLWDLLPGVAPELSEWAEFFTLTTARSLRSGQRAATASSATSAPASAPVSAREADDLLRQAEIFVDLVCRALGLPVAPPHGDVLVPTAWA